MHTDQFYINGLWVAPRGKERRDVIDPATESAVAEIAMGNVEDVDDAVLAARQAFEGFAATPLAERIALLERILAEYERRSPDLARAMTSEMGAPASFASR